ncbi:MAG: hypothetical protein AAGF11_38625 [Myxococcota bacterium]
MPSVKDTMGSGGVATSSRRDDRSGLLDIRALSSVIDAQQRARPSASASSVALPSFSTPWAMQDLRAVPTPAPTVEVPPTPAAPGGNRLLYAMIGALSLAVASLGVYVVLRPTPTVVVSKTAPLAPMMAAAGSESPASGAEPEPGPEPESVAAVDAAEPEPEPEAAAEPEAVTKPGRTRTRTRPRGRRPARSPDDPRSASKPSSKPKDDGVLPVECVIDPSQCSKTRTRTPPSPQPSPEGLPSTPNSTQVRSAMAEVKPQAKACGPRHGGRAGTKVRVKLSAAGATGRITSAKALDEHAGTALGRCVAQALSKATLPRFSKKQAGIVYAVRL